MATAIGTRVGALCHADAEEVHLLGFGVYEGEYAPPFGPNGSSKQEYEAWVALGKHTGRLPDDYRYTTARIRLDDGTIVWGAQCWFGPEERVRADIGNRRVVMVSPSDPFQKSLGNRVFSA